MIDNEDRLTSFKAPQVVALGLNPTDEESATLGTLSCDQEIVTGPGETRADVFEKDVWQASSCSACWEGETFGAGAPGTRIGIWPSEGKDVVEKREGAGFRGGGVGVGVTGLEESEAPCVGSERPFSLTWGRLRGVVLDWLVWSDAFGDDTLPWGEVPSEGLPFLIALLTLSAPSVAQIPIPSTGVFLESSQFCASVWNSPAPLNRFKLKSSSPSEEVLRLRPPSPFTVSLSFLRCPFLPIWRRIQEGIDEEETHQEFF